MAARTIVFVEPPYVCWDRRMDRVREGEEEMPGIGPLVLAAVGRERGQRDGARESARAVSRRRRARPAAGAGVGPRARLPARFSAERLQLPPDAGREPGDVARLSVLVHVLRSLDVGAEGPLPRGRLRD